MISTAGPGIASPYISSSPSRDGSKLDTLQTPEQAAQAAESTAPSDGFRERPLSLSPSGAEAAAEPTSPKVGLLRTLGLAFMTALSVAGCTGGPGTTPVTATATQSMPTPTLPGKHTVRERPQAAPFTGTLASAEKPVKLTASDYERVYQAVPVLRPQQKGQHPAVRFERIAPTTSPEDLQRLADHYATNAPIIDAMIDPEATPAQITHIQRDLGVLPTNLLAEARTQGLRIWVANPGVKEVPVRFFTQKAPDLATGKVDKEPCTVGPTLAQAPTSKGGKQSAEERKAANPDEPHAGDTIETLARRRGASTPEQIDAFVRLTVKMNPLKGGKPFDPQAPLAEGQKVNIPDLGFYQGVAVRASKLGGIRNANASLSKPTVAGFYNSGSHLLMIRSTALPDASKTMGGARAIIHEFGHAAEDLISDDEIVGRKHVDNMVAQSDIAVAKYNKGDDLAFITDYATTNRGEHYAEAFEAYFTADRPDASHKGSLYDGNFRQLQVHEPGYADVIQNEMHMWEQDQIRPVDILTRLGLN